MVFPRYRLAVFIHGCFWHGHICREARPPKSNTSYWWPKILRNVERDLQSVRLLRDMGWNVVTIRECQARQGTEELLMLLRNMRSAGHCPS